VSETEPAPAQHQQTGRYLARCGQEIVASAATYDELSDQLDQAAVDWSELVIEYVGPTDRVHVY